MDDQKQKALDAAMKAIDKNFGKGMLMKMGDKPIEKREGISTGSLGLDIALGIGGVPKSASLTTVSRRWTSWRPSPVAELSI